MRQDWWWNVDGDEFVSFEEPMLMTNDRWAEFLADLAGDEPIIPTLTVGDGLSRVVKIEHRQRWSNETGKCSHCPPHDGENAVWGNRRPRWQREQGDWLCGEWKLDRKSKAVK